MKRKIMTLVTTVTYDFPVDYDSYYSDYRSLVQGLVYDRASNEIRYGDTVCAKVSEHRFLITRWHSIDETSAAPIVPGCRFVMQIRSVGSDLRRSCSVLML